MFEKYFDIRFMINQKPCREITLTVIFTKNAQLEITRLLFLTHYDYEKEKSDTWVKCVYKKKKNEIFQ